MLLFRLTLDSRLSLFLFGHFLHDGFVDEIHIGKTEIGFDEGILKKGQDLSSEVIGIDGGTDVEDKKEELPEELRHESDQEDLSDIRLFSFGEEVMDDQEEITYQHDESHDSMVFPCRSCGGEVDHIWNGVIEDA